MKVRLVYRRKQQGLNVSLNAMDKLQAYKNRQERERAI